MDEDVTYLTQTCPRCRKPLPPAAAEGLCAACLLASGLETLTSSSGGHSLSMTPAGGAAAADTPDVRLTDGQTWGPYRIGRLLGRGGMGEVYEAEHVESGRRVALKVLRSRLRQPDDRARFLREGQLAASISHPHTVYIFGSEEIAGLPVISMELLPGGTLKDRVAAQGPLPVADAVSAVLDIIGGLDAAQAAGILHRDIKPSNCFVDSDGAVKVGDFGLSISTLARDVHQELATEGFQGTPQFAPPEQLRGEPLDVRADIYAVGATLYYLLTGRPPFDAPDLRTLFDRVRSEPPVSPRQLRRGVPSALAGVVLRCLAKSPGERPSSYAALADALRPFATTEDTPAPRGVRFMAGIVDFWIASLPPAFWQMATTDFAASENAGDERQPWAWLVSVLYFFCLEAWWGTSVGKALFGLRVTAHGAARVRSIAIRTAAFHLPYLIYTVAILALGPVPTLPNLQLSRNMMLSGPDFTRPLEGAIVLAMIAMLFTTARAVNGWAGLHEVLSGTRVVSRHGRARRRGAPVASPQPTPRLDAAAGTRLGPFVVPGHVSHRIRETTLVGIDPLLRREVWVHAVPPGTPPVSPVRRDLSRDGRLHWLTGRRSPTENWDAYEAPDGAALTARDPAPVDWPHLKSWLTDLASELTASAADGSTPSLRADRLWLRRDGRLVLLDFAPPGQHHDSVDLEPAALLTAVAAEGSRPSELLLRYPLSARTLLNAWSERPPASLDAAHQELLAATGSADAVSRRKRMLPIALAAAPTMCLVTFALAIGLPTMERFFGPEATEMLELLEGVYQSGVQPQGPWGDPAMRNAAETYLAGRHRARMIDRSFWNSPLMRQLKPRLEPVALRVASERGQVSGDDVASAASRLEPRLAQMRSRRSADWSAMTGIVVTAPAAACVLLTIICALFSSAIARGGIVTRLLGLAVVDAGGREVGRWRSVARAGVAWLPAIAWLAYLAWSPKVQGFVPVPPSPLLGATLTFVALAAGAAWTIARPTRGPHDWAARTWVVAR